MTHEASAAAQSVCMKRWLHRGLVKARQAVRKLGVGSAIEEHVAEKMSCGAQHCREARTKLPEVVQFGHGRHAAASVSVQERA
jgi:hypothetical protein